MSNYFKYFLRKSVWYLFTLIIAIALNFILPRLIEGNPVDFIMAKVTKGMTDANSIKSMYENYMAEFKLDLPMWKQFLHYVVGVFQGDLGTSFGQYPRKVTEIIGHALPWTIALQLPAIITGWVIGNVLGAIAAYKKGIYDKLIFPLTLFISSIPFFVFSILLLYGFSMIFEIFPSSGSYAYGMNIEFSLDFILSAIKHHTLPFLSIVLVMIGGQGIGMREMSIYELNADYVKYSKLMGIRDSKIIKYVFRNAMLPQITGLILSLGTVIAGGLITEIVFSYQGLGTVMFNAIKGRDYPLISGCTLIVSITILISSFILDVVYGLVDPRIKAAQTEELS
jgi:peptide/nickel transport system permease protein